MSVRAAGLFFALVVTGRAIAQQPVTLPDLLKGIDPLAITLAAPLTELFDKGTEDEKFSVSGSVSYKDPSSGAEVKREAQVSVRGHTSRRETECTFPNPGLDTIGPNYARLPAEELNRRPVLVSN